MQRIKMLHTLLFRDEKKDVSFLCFELLLLILSHYHIDHKPFSVNTNGSLSVDPALPSELKSFFMETWSGNQTVYNSMERTLSFSLPINVFILMVWYAQEVYGHGGQSARVIPSYFPSHVIEGAYPDGLKKVQQLLSVIQ